MTAMPTSPLLRRTLRTEQQARHAIRMRALLADMEAHGATLEDLSAAFHNEWMPAACTDVRWLHPDGHWVYEGFAKHHIIRALFKSLRNNLKAAKGDWAKAMGYVTDDAEALRDEQQEAIWQDNRAEERHQRAYAKG